MLRLSPRTWMERELGKMKKAKIIFCCAMFYDLENPGKFLKEVLEVLDDEGVFVIQMNYLGLMLKNLAFDNIGHEHLSYYSLSSLKELLDSNGFVVVDVSLNQVNGGSIRVYCRKALVGLVWEQKRRVRAQLEEERNFLGAGSLVHFSERVGIVSRQLREFLVNLKLRKKVVYAYGASTRGMTLLQTVFPGRRRVTEYLAGVAERDERKIGLKMAGVNLPIVSEQEAREKADYFLLLPYSFWASISQREKTWMLCGGKMILPLPIPRIAKMVDLEGKGKFVLCSNELDAELKELVPV